jgi:hypothetical protein
MELILRVHQAFRGDQQLAEIALLRLQKLAITAAG